MRDSIFDITVLEQQEPSLGDVLISREGSWYLVTIVPNRQQLRLADSRHALQIASEWARTHGVRVWRTDSGVLVRIQ